MTDFNNEPDNEMDDLGLEKMLYTKFYQTYVVKRPAQAPIKFDTWSKLQLPTGSILHTLNGFDTLVSPSDGLPDPLLPLVINEKLPIYLKVSTSLAGETSRPFGVSDNYIYRPNTIMAGISHFFQTHRKYHRVLSDRTLASMQGVLTWIDYSPLNEVKVNGTLGSYRKFDLLFRTILDTVINVGPNRHHYIVFPQSDQVFSRPVIQRAFKELSNGSLNAFAHDPSIFPIIHLLGFVYGKTHELEVKPYKEDLKILGKDAEIFNQVKTTSLFERIDPSYYASINFIFQKDDRAIIYNLEDLARFAEDASFYPKLYRHIMNLRLNGSTIPSHVDPDSEQFDTLVETIAKSEEPKEEIPVEAPEEVVPPKDVIVSASGHDGRTGSANIIPITGTSDVKTPLIVDEVKSSSTYEDKIRKSVVEPSKNIIPLEAKVESKRNQLLDQHFKVMLGGKTLGELIHEPPVETITPKEMKFSITTPEASYKQSSLLALDKAYQTHAYHHELAKVVGSLAKHGLYATKVEEDVNHTEMDRTITYKVHLSDLNGKAHHVKFTLPDIDSNGNMLLGGIEYRLTRQIANVPICKISPTRVNLSSYYNKIIVERISTKRNSYEQDISKLIIDLRQSGLVKAIVGSAPLPTQSVPYDYTAIGRGFTEIRFDGLSFFFGGDHSDLSNFSFDAQDLVKALNGKYGIVAGSTLNDNLLFWDKANQIHEIDRVGKLIQSWRSFNHLLVDRLGAEAELVKTSTEWTQANILNQTIPLIFILSYKLGLKTVLDKINLDYRFYPTGVKPEVDTMDIVIRFSDGTLVFNRYPLSRSLIASGLAWVNLKDISFRDLSLPETYAKVFQKKDMSIGVLKGLSGFFDFFVDPITESILEKMHEPTTFEGLLLRANVMLSDYLSDESSSVKLHRFRLYERFNGIVYNEISRGLANHRNNPSSKKAFSINPEAVFQKIVQDATISPNDVINPVHEVKQRANFTFTGSGGRTPNSFVLRDRIYPKDGLGVISDAVPDSGKVGITAYLSASPNINDIHGIPKPYQDGDTLEPPQILSIGSMVMPGGTTDDGKRNSYLSIQISHYVPNHDEGETLAVRTGYDEVLPHLSTDTFAVAADDDGVVEFVNEKQKVVQVRYKDKLTPVVRTLKLPYIDAVLNEYRDNGTSFGFLVPEESIGEYPMGGVFNLTKSTNGKIVDRLRCETVEAIPNKDIARKQNTLIQDLVRGRYKALYYIRFIPMGIKTPGVVKCYSYEDIYSPISGAYLLQVRKPNVLVGEKFKAGDILVFNPGFFVNDPLSKQVTFKHGVTATVALIEKSSNHEDACEISRELSNRLKMTPCHQREIITKKDAVLLDMVKLGDHVETSDSLCVISDDYLIQSSFGQDVENLDIMEKLNRQTPVADYTGYIRKIRVLYGCERNELSESLKTLLKVYEKEVRDNFKALNSDPSIKPPEFPGKVAPKTKYKGIDFTNDTVVIEFMIEETLGVSEGDKICIGNSNKSIVSYVNEKPHFTESGVPIDILFSTTSIINRIVMAPMSIGIVERNQAALKQKVLDIYFG